MAQEIEAKFLHVDIADIRTKLQAVGAHLEQPMRLMRRDQFDYADDRYQHGNFTERLRVRDEGDKCTVTYKKALPDSPYPVEIETVVGSYDEMKQLLLALGLHSFSYQESRRETWQLGDSEVVIDEWPWLKPYIEIEGPSEPSIQAAAKRLGFDWTDAAYGSVDTAYRAEYPGMSDTDSIGYVATVKFDMPVPAYLQERL